VFWCISWPPESSPSKIIFQCLECLKTCFDESPHHQIQVTKKLFFNVWIVVKNVFFSISRPPESSPYKRLFLTSEVSEKVFLCICAYFQATRIKSLKNYFFHLWSGSKRVLMHFLTTRIKSLKNYFFTSGVVKNVFLCICAYFQTTRIKSLKNYCFHLWSN
jgi:hypothetical protein